MKAIILQSICGLIATLITTVFFHFDINSILSGLLGIIVALLATLLLKKIMLYKIKRLQPKKALKQYYLAIIIRLVIILFSFIVIAILYKQCNYISLIIAYLVTNLSIALIDNFNHK